MFWRKPGFQSPGLNDRGPWVLTVAVRPVRSGPHRAPVADTRLAPEEDMVANADEGIILILKYCSVCILWREPRQSTAMRW